MNHDDLDGVVIVGAGGHGRELLDLLKDCHSDNLGARFLGFVDDVAPDAQVLARIGARWLGPLSHLASMSSSVRYCLGLGDGGARRRVDAQLRTTGLRPLSLIHPTATVGTDVRVAEGVVICAHVAVTTNVSIGRHAHLNRLSTLGHDSDLGDYATLNPLASISGNVSIGSGATIGTGASVKQGLRIGTDAIVGSGAAVVSDVRSGATVVGVPARELRPSSP